jgi:hypothetical protein
MRKKFSGIRKHIYERLHGVGGTIRYDFVLILWMQDSGSLFGQQVFRGRTNAYSSGGKNGKRVVITIILVEAL